MATYRRELQRSRTEAWHLVYVNKPLDLYVQHVQGEKAARIELRDYVEAEGYGAL